MIDHLMIKVNSDMSLARLDEITVLAEGVGGEYGLCSCVACLKNSILVM